MKNNHFKNALISGACAIISGVLLLGANAVFGEAPTHEPPGTGIAPTFTGLTVNGTAALQNVNATGTVTATNSNMPIVSKITGNVGSLYGGKNLNGEWRFAINLENNIVKFYDRYSGTWKSGLSMQDGNISIGTASSPSTLSVNGTVDNPTSGTPVIVNDDLSVSGTSQLNNVAAAGYVQVGKDITILGHLKAAGGIGNFSDVASDLVSVPAGTLRMAEVGCPSGQVITGCGFYKSDATYLLAITAVVKGSNTCQAVGRNQHSINTYQIQARAFCFNSNG